MDDHHGHRSSFFKTPKRLKSTLFKGRLQLIADWKYVEGLHEHVHGSWMELFFDLVYVAALAHSVGEIVKAISMEDDEIEKVATLFSAVKVWIVLYQAWLESVLLTSRFRYKGMRFKWWFVLYMTGVLIMAEDAIDGRVDFCSQDEFETHKCVGEDWYSTLGYCISRLMLCVAYAFLSTIPSAKFYAWFNCGIYFFQGLIWVMFVMVQRLNKATTLIRSEDKKVEESKHSWSLISAATISLVAPAVLFYFERTKLPLNIHHMNARMGEFMMFMIGEGLLIMLTAEIDNDEVSEFVWIYWAAFMLLFLMGSTYYESSEKALQVKIKDLEGKYIFKHALTRQGHLWRNLWFLGHMLLFGMMMIMHVGFKAMFKYGKYPPYHSFFIETMTDRGLKKNVFENADTYYPQNIEGCDECYESERDPWGNVLNPAAKKVKCQELNCMWTSVSNVTRIGETYRGVSTANYTYGELMQTNRNWLEHCLPESVNAFGQTAYLPAFYSICFITGWMGTNILIQAIRYTHHWNQHNILMLVARIVVILLMMIPILIEHDLSIVALIVCAAGAQAVIHGIDRLESVLWKKFHNEQNRKIADSRSSRYKPPEMTEGHTSIASYRCTDSG